MDLSQALNQFYYNMILNELRLMHTNTLYPNITYNSLLYLDLISCKEPCTVSYLAEALHISKSAVTVKVNELIRQGLVVKEQSKIDKRVYYLTVSPAAMEEYRKYDVKLNFAKQKLKARYSADEMALFCEMMEFFNDCYKEG